MYCNGVEGIYTDMFFKMDNKYKYVKYSIEYMSRCDSDGISHPDEGIKYYVLHELVINDLDEKFEIPEPTGGINFNDDLACLVNNYGRFRYVFDDEETAKNVVKAELLHMIYPYTYMLNDEELNEWKTFLDKQNQEGNK